MGRTGDTDAPARMTLKSLLQFGLCHEKLFPYKIEDFDQEPSKKCYADAEKFQMLKYFCLDTPDRDLGKLLFDIKNVVAQEVPLMFGFTVFESIKKAQTTARIPFPTKTDRPLGGHAIVCVGYSDAKKSLIIRNSWGEKWAVIKVSYSLGRSSL